MKSVVPAVLFIAGLFVSPAYAAPQSCEQLARLALPHASIISAQTIAAGAFTPPANATPWLVVIASKLEGSGADPKVKLSRPLCPYPQQAQYKGSGDPNDDSNFTCETPK
jgi:hypothetical protein